MLGRFLSIGTRIWESLWALPLAVAAAGAALAILALGAELPATTDLAWLYTGTAQQAQSFTGSLVGGMITLSTLAFSITMVVLTLAAQQLGPRLLQIFMGDKQTQLTLGLFLGTIVYLLLVLRAIDGESGETPNLAITVGTGLVLASVVTLLFFVHSLARSIVSDHVISRVGAVLDRSIDRVFPAEADDKPKIAAPAGGSPIRSENGGYIEHIDYEGLAEAACERDATLVLIHQAGDHVLPGSELALCHGAEPAQFEEPIRRFVLFAAERTVGSDPQRSIGQLVEVALRALSAGINDVFTAVAVIDRLARTLARVLRRGVPSEAFRDQQGVVRVFGPQPSFEVLLDTAFDQIRESGAGNHFVLLKLAENLKALGALATDRDRQALLRHTLLVAAVAHQTIETQADRDRIDRVVEKTKALLKQEAPTRPAA